jgi:hypothetical protein
MNKQSWLAASIAMGLTVGFGARFLTADDAAAAFRTGVPTTGGVVATMTETAAGPWMHPGITVVVQVPAKKDEGFELASSAGETRSASDGSLRGEAAEGPWMHPAITVVVQVPAKADEGFVLASSSGEAASAGDTPALEEVAEGTWMHPAITVVVKVPARVDRTFALGDTPSATRPGPTSLRRVGDGNPGFPVNRFRDLRRFDERDFERARGRNWRPAPNRPQVEAGAAQTASNV